MNKEQSYKWAAKKVRAQVLRNIDRTATLANTAAILKEYFPSMFWVGFYQAKTDHLLLGPFQGPPACVKLSYDKGVCAAAWRKKQTILVADVEKFPGHVACDSRSKSEIVVPIIKNENVVAVLDIDSAELNGFDETDKDGLEEIAKLLMDIY